MNFYRGVFIANAWNEELYRSLFLFIFKFLKGQQALLTNDTNIILVHAIVSLSLENTYFVKCSMAEIAPSKVFSKK